MPHIVNNHGIEYENDVIYLESDITLGNEPFILIGMLAHPFKGTFDGGGYTITGMKITDVDGKDCYSLFGVVLDASISYVKLYDVDIHVDRKF